MLQVFSLVFLRTTIQVLWNIQVIFLCAIGIFVGVIYCRCFCHKLQVILSCTIGVQVIFCMQLSYVLQEFILCVVNVQDIQCWNLCYVFQVFKCQLQHTKYLLKIIVRYFMKCMDVVDFLMFGLGFRHSKTKDLLFQKWEVQLIENSRSTI